MKIDKHANQLESELLSLTSLTNKDLDLPRLSLSQLFIHKALFRPLCVQFFLFPKQEWGRLLIATK